MKEFKILIVDDSDKDALLYKTYLNNSVLYEFDVHVTETGQEGIELLKSSDYDCIILDHILPDMNSIEFLEEVNPKEISTPIVLITGYCDRQMDQKMIQIGVADYLDKDEVYPKLFERIILHSIERHRLARELIIANQSKEMFLKNISAKIRSPLDTLIRQCSTYFETGLQTSSPGHMLDVLKHIQMSAKEQLNFLDKLMMKSILEIESTPIKMKYVDISNEIERLNEAYRSRAEKKKLEFRLHMSGKKCLLFLDKKKIFIALECLLDNAIKFTGKGCINLNVEVCEKKIAFTVEDTGMGISTSVLPKIFAPYTHGSSQIARKFGGLGNGLTVAKHIVRLHGGTLQIEPKKPRGVIARMVLPLKKIKKTPTSLPQKKQIDLGRSKVHKKELV